ncbi:MAG: pentapeptide repeat-containing protein [Bacteroidetes bacterium]|nr:pentapeptide repeat-containing protein [Bacteroidota bacterium]
MKNELLMNNSAISPYKYKFLLAILLITIIASISPLNSFAQEEKEERGWYERLTKSELKQELLNLKEYEFVVGYVIKGSDIIEIIEETDLDIKIKNSFIEGGLDFTKLPIVNEKREVNNKISIINSAIKVFRDQSEDSDEIYTMSVSTFDEHSIIFNKLFDLSRSQFSGEAFFFKAEFSDTASFSKAQFGERASFSKAQFSEKAYFYNAQYLGRAGFIGTQFSGRADFGGAQFSEFAFFWEAQFSGEASFEVATFTNLVVFDRAVFSKPFSPFLADYAQYASFRNTRFRKINSDTYQPVQTSRFSFKDAKILEAHFENLVFTQDIIFSDAQFGSPLFTRDDINWIILRKDSEGNPIYGFIDDFKIQFNSEGHNPSKRIWYRLDKPLQALINGLDLGDKSTINKMKDSLFIGGKHDLVDSFIKQLNSILKQKDFYKKEYFVDTELSKQTEQLLTDIDKLSETQILMLNRFVIEKSYREELKQVISEEQLKIKHFPSVFRNVTFESDVFFIRAKFYDDIAFENVNFKGEADFSHVSFEDKEDWKNSKHRFSLSYLNFDNLEIDFNHLPDEKSWVRNTKDRILSSIDKDRKQRGRENYLKPLQPLSEVFEDLEATFSRNNMLSDKNKAFYHMKVEELEETRAGKSLYQQLTTGEVWGWILWGWSSGWGTKIWRIVGVYSAGLFFFTFIFYGFSGRVKKKDPDEIKPDTEFRMRLINFPWYFIKSVEIINEKLKNFFVALRLSKVLLLKVGRRDTEVEGKLMKSIVWIEWVFGYYLLAVLVITLKNTVPIINSLISGVF